MSMVSPFANSIRQQPIDASQFGLGALLERLNAAQPNNRITRDVPQENVYGNMVGSLSQNTPDPVPMRPQIAMTQGPPDPMMPTNLSRGPENFYAVNRPQQLRPANPFEGNEQYQALMEFQQSLSPNQEQQARLQELRSAFEGTGAFKDYRINQLQNQLQQRQRNPMMGMGLGGMRPMGMQPYQGFGRPPMMQQRPMQQPMITPRGGYAQYNQMNQPRQFGAMGYNQPQQQYMNPYQQMRPQPQQFGGYGMGQQMGGYGSYGQMPNPYQPQQFGYNTNNSMNYAQPQHRGMNQAGGFGQGYGGMMAQQQAVY